MKHVNIYRSQLEYSENESYKSLRTNLFFCGEEKKTIAVTSCTPNEGKSTVSLNLAMSLADSGKKVLFIEADLRKSVLIGRTEVEEEIKGLSHFLSYQVRKLYDYVIIDTPPLGSVIDGAVIADECDGSVLVIESGAISYRFAREVKEQLEKCNSPVLGVILNKVDMNKQEYYGKYYGKYYGNK